MNGRSRFRTAITRRPASGRRAEARAFTLVETIAAIVILAIAIPPMLWAVREAEIQRVDPILVSRARWLAIEKLEDVIADRNSTTRGWSYLVSGNYAAESPVTGYTGFDRAVTLTEYQADLSTPDSSGGYMVVDVDVDWTDGTGTARTLSVSTVLTEYAP